MPLLRTELTVEELRERVLHLWDKNDGWIPGCDYARLAEALGVPAERTKKMGNR